MDALNIRHCRLLRAEAPANPIAKRGWGGPGALGLPEKGGGGRRRSKRGLKARLALTLGFARCPNGTLCAPYPYFMDPGTIWHPSMH